MSPTSSTRKTTGTTDDPTILDQFIAERLPGWLRTASREQARAVSAALIRHQASLEALTELFQLLQRGFVTGSDRSCVGRGSGGLGGSGHGGDGFVHVVHSKVGTLLHTGAGQRVLPRGVEFAPFHH